MKDKSKKSGTTLRGIEILGLDSLEETPKHRFGKS